VTRTSALAILIVVELGSVIYTAISLHDVLSASSPGDAIVIPLLTAVAMIVVYGVFNWVAFELGRGDLSDRDEPS
jgi:hypothetical protein